MKIALGGVLAAVFLAGCADAVQQVSPVSSSSDVTAVAPPPVQQTAVTASEPARALKRICIVENPRVMHGEFLPAYRDALEKKGYAVTVVQKNPQPSQCPLTTRYTALGFDRPLIRLEIYRDGKPAGAASHRGLYSEKTIRELVNKLLP